jgi:hypothetical protein
MPATRGRYGAGRGSEASAGQLLTSSGEAQGRRELRGLPEASSATSRLTSLSQASEAASRLAQSAAS